MDTSWQILRRARQEAGMTQAQVARAARVTQSAIAHMERPGSNPTIRTLSAALAATGNHLTIGALPRKVSVDETLIARNLRLTPAARLAAFEVALSETESLRGLASRG